MFEQEHNRYWKTVVNTISDGIMIVDKRGTIVSVNRAFSRITGYDAKDLVGESCSILGCDQCEINSDKNSPHWCKLFSNGNISRRKCMLKKQDSSFVNVLKNASLLHDADGQVMGAVETVTDITELLTKEQQINLFQQELRKEEGFHGLVGACVSMRNLYEMIRDAAASDAPVIILGESGTGKELVARAIHEIGSRKNEPLVKVNCAALNESLLESELFGHVKGSFTGAHKDRKGRFELAGNGDIFLDEIGDLPLSTQVKLLRVLEEKVIERVGDHVSIPVSARIITATNKNLEDLVSQEKLRQDFYYRVNVIPIELPPLRQRKEDIPLLAESFMQRNRLKSGKNIESITPEAMDLLMSYSWPGNVRELKSAIHYAFVTCRGQMVEPGHLPRSLHNQEKMVCMLAESDPAHSDPKRIRLIEALKQTGGNQSQAARILGVSRVTIWNRIKKYKIDMRTEIR